MTDTKLHNYDHLLFDIAQQNESVTISCIDDVTNASYQGIFEQEYIVNVLSLKNINIFCDVIRSALRKKELTYVINHDNIDIHIHTTMCLFTFDIKFLLPMVDPPSPSIEPTYVEKLHKKIKRLEDIMNNQLVIIATIQRSDDMIVCTNVVNNVIFYPPLNGLYTRTNECSYIGFNSETRELTITPEHCMMGRRGYKLLPTLHSIRTKRITYSDGIDKTKLNMDLFPVLYEENDIS